MTTLVSLIEHFSILGSAHRSSLEDRGETGLEVAHVCLHGRGWASLGQACWLELRLVIFFFHFPLYKLQRILLVRRERSQTLVVADFGWLRGPERLVVLHEWGRLRRDLPVRVIPVFADNLSVCVEEMGLLDLLRERFLLLEFLAFQTCLCRELLWSIKVVLNVRDHAAEGCVLADFTNLRGISQEITRLDVDLARILFVSEVFLDVVKFFHVLVSGLHWVLNVVLRLEGLLVTN